MATLLASHSCTVGYFVRLSLAGKLKQLALGGCLPKNGTILDITNYLHTYLDITHTYLHSTGKTDHPDGNSVHPHGNSVHPHGNSVHPHGNSVHPHGNSAHPHGNSVCPDGNSVRLHGKPVRLDVFLALLRPKTGIIADLQITVQAIKRV